MQRHDTIIQLINGFLLLCRVRTPLSWGAQSLCFTMSKIFYSAHAPKSRGITTHRAVECSEHSKPEANMPPGKADAFKTWMEPLLLSKSQIFPTPTS